MDTLLLHYLIMEYFCSNQSLFSWESIISMCTVDSLRLRSQPQFKELCETKGPAHCCPGWSLGGYIGLLHKRSSCFGIQVSDILYKLPLLTSTLQRPKKSKNPHNFPEIRRFIHLGFIKTVLSLLP